MKLLLVKWIILIVSFVLSDATPVTQQPSNNVNVTNELNNDIAAIFKFFQPYWNGTFTPSDEDSVQKFNNQSSNDVLYNVTLKFERWPPSKTKLPLNSNDNFMVSGQLKSVFLEGYLRDSNHRIVTEKFSINYVVTVTILNEVSVDFPNFDRNGIKLLTSDYQNKLTKENNIKKEIETHIKATLNKFIAVENKDSWIVFKHNTLELSKKISYNNQERYYFIGSIPSTNYTLNNVTITGLWNGLSITFNVSNLEAFPQIEMSSVKGSMVQKFTSTFEQLSLSFKADNVYIWVDRNIAKVNVKIEAYSVINNKLNTSLSEDQSKLIIREIESAFATPLETVWKHKIQTKQL